jgi:hypothetical protein
MPRSPRSMPGSRRNRANQQGSIDWRVHGLMSLLALSGRPEMSALCPLSGGKADFSQRWPTGRAWSVAGSQSSLRVKMCSGAGDARAIQ